MKKILSNIFSIYLLQSIVFMLFGLLLLLSPDMIIIVISCMIGIYLIVTGLYFIIYKEKNYYKNTLIQGILLTTFGLILIINTSIIATMVSIMVGIYMIILGVKKIDTALKLKDFQVVGWPYKMIMAVLTTICGIILLINPLKGAFIATKMIGIIIIIYSIIDIIDTIIFRKSIKKLDNIIY